MRRSAARLLIIATVSTLVAPARAEERPSAFTFRFDPDPAQRWEVLAHDEQNEDYKGMRPPRNQVTETDFRHRYEQQEDGTWVLVQVARDLTMTIDGQVMQNPMFEVIVGHELRMQLDENGRGVDVTGFRELMRRYEREVDPGLYQRIRETMSVESMVASELVKRNKLLDMVAGQTASIGEKWGVEDVVFYQTTQTPVRGVLEFEAWTEIDGVSGVKVVYRYDHANRHYQEALAEIRRETSIVPEGMTVSPSNVETWGQYTWVIDPASSQVLYEVFEQSVRVPLTFDPNSERAEFESAHTWRWSLLPEDEAGESR